jgi:hypothetical protein
MQQIPPPRNQPAGWTATGVKLTQSDNFNHSAPPQVLDTGRIRIAKTVAQFAAAHRSGPYSELRLVLPSKTPARARNVSVSQMLRLLSGVQEK